KQLTGEPVSLPPNPDADLKAVCNELILSPDGSNERQQELLETILAQAPSTIERFGRGPALSWSGMAASAATADRQASSTATTSGR
ncbi:MAG: hypothetical protein ACRYHQ_05015, partial [Janthinobacterium lividum]